MSDLKVGDVCTLTQGKQKYGCGICYNCFSGEVKILEIIGDKCKIEGQYHNDRIERCSSVSVELLVLSKIKSWKERMKNENNTG